MQECKQTYRLLQVEPTPIQQSICANQMTFSLIPKRTCNLSLQIMSQCYQKWMHRIQTLAPVCFSEVFLKGVPQLFVTFVSMLLNITSERKLCKPSRLNVNDFAGKTCKKLSLPPHPPSSSQNVAICFGQMSCGCTTVYPKHTHTHTQTMTIY